MAFFFSLSDSKSFFFQILFFSSTFYFLAARFHSVVKCFKTFHFMWQYLHLIIHMCKKRRPNMNSSNYIASISIHINFTFEHTLHMTDKKKRGGRTKIHLFLTFKLIRKEFYRHYWIVIACICYARKEKLDKKETNLKLFSCSRNQIDLDSFLPSSFFLFFAIQVFRILLVEIFFPNRILHLTKWNTSNCAVLLMKIKQSNRKPNKFSFFFGNKQLFCAQKKFNCLFIMQSLWLYLNNFYKWKSLQFVWVVVVSFM